VLAVGPDDLDIDWQQVLDEDEWPSPPIYAEFSVPPDVGFRTHVSTQPGLVRNVGLPPWSLADRQVYGSAARR
jgi:hypothetical protein